MNLQCALRTGARTPGMNQSITATQRACIEMKIRIAKQFIEDAGTLQEEADVELVCHADPAMHLYGFIHRKGCYLAGSCFGGGNGIGAVSNVRIDRALCLGQRGAAKFNLAVQNSASVLQGLKLSDELAELAPLFQVGDCSFEGFIRDTQQFGGGRNSTSFQSGGQTRSQGVLARIGVPKQCIGWELDVLELNASGIVRIHHRRSFDGDPRQRRVDEKECYAFGRRSWPMHTGGDDQKIRHMPIKDKGLRAVERPPSDMRGGGRCDAIRPMLSCFVDSKRGDSLAECQSRQPFLLLRLCTRHTKRSRSDDS